MSSCELVPSVTLWGTSQITTTVPVILTSTIQVTGSPQIHLTTNPNGVPCPPGQQFCQFGQTQLVTDTPVYPSTTLITTQTVSVTTAIVPQKTLYYPCSSGGVDGAQNAEVAPSSTIATSTSAAVRLTSSSHVGPASSSMSPIQQSSTKVVVEQSSTKALVVPLSSSATPPPPVGASDSQAVTSTSSSAGDGSTEQGNDVGSKTSHPNTPVIGGIIGGIAVALLLIVLCLWCRRGREGSRRNSGAPTDFWERRFRQLEAEGDVDDDEEKIVAEGGGVERVGSKKIRLTLDLASKDLPTATRPASTLSALSSFFKTRSPHALPFRASPTGPSAKPLNFSRPRFGQNYKRSSVGTSRSKSSHKTARSVKSFSNWLSIGGPRAASNAHSSYPDTPASIFLDTDVGRGRSDDDPEYLERSYDPNDPSAPNPFHEVHSHSYTPSIERSSSDGSTGHSGIKTRRLTPAAPPPFPPNTPPRPKVWSARP